MILDDDYFEAADEELMQMERNKAREIRRSQWWQNQKGRGLCHYCKENIPPKELTMDHIVPIVRGGLSSKGNIVTACKECNTSKGHKLLYEWKRKS